MFLGKNGSEPALNWGRIYADVGPDLRQLRTRPIF